MIKKASREIILTQNKKAIVDKSDFEAINSKKWYAYFDGFNYYAGRMTRDKNGKRQTIRMHREIMRPKLTLFVDHINGDTLDNRRRNLRIVTHKQNCINRSIRKDNSTGVKGVHYDKTSKKYVARIMVKNKRMSLGYYLSKGEAKKHYELAAKKYHKQYARKNI